ncbi:amino acid permease [Sporosarcina sp. BI001-red]|uniref:APC family permease n=1 Tax=Sporosarcina sp. BI001-red TaxID=2282866 RepID=UPI000E282319|nr:APC family permease [Sporosarcina sp. BI001-red]REB08760.1 amino acid permease [Sporosarcina sp. BI001-red]
MGSQEAKLKKVLGLGDLMGIAVGQVIGVGIMALMGVAIGMTGKAVVLAFVVSSVFTCITIIPLTIMATTMPTTGAQYRYSSLLLSPKIGFFWMLLFIFSKVTIAVYAISFAQYLQGLVPGIPIMPAAFVILTVLYITNMIGVKTAAVVEKIMVLVLLLALGIFLAYGLPATNFAEVFNPKDMFPSGFIGFFTAVGLLAFATGGATSIAELGGEMKNPGRDIPITIFGTTLGVGVLYALMAIVAVGILPIADVANKPLTDVARTILPGPLFLFFIIGGALFALATTLNALLTWVTKGMIIACEDGWLPKSLGVVNKKYGTPHRLLTLFYIIGVIPILGGVSLDTISKLGLGVLLFAAIIPVIAVTQLPKKYPELYAKSKFKLPPKVLMAVVVVSILLLAFQSTLMIMTLPVKIMLGAILYMIAAGIYVTFAKRKNPVLEMEEVLAVVPLAAEVEESTTFN